MPNIAIVYFSAGGTTAKLAEAIASGAKQFAEPIACRIAAEDIALGRYQNNEMMRIIDNADGIVFGSPTYMGGPAAQFKAFADASSDRWSEQRWANKFAAGFTAGSTANGDQSHTLTYFTVLAAQHGMLWCGLDIPGGGDPHDRNRLGNQTGLVCHTVDGEIAVSDLATARHLGERLAWLTARPGFGAPGRIQPAG